MNGALAVDFTETASYLLQPVAMGFHRAGGCLSLDLFDRGLSCATVGSGFW